MKNFPWKRIYPHLIAIGVFLIVTLLFCKTGLESGKTLNKYDMVLVQGMQQNLIDNSANGSPLWLSSMFGGMPAYVLGVPAPTMLTETVQKIMTLSLPEPFQYFFLCCICFYIFCMCIGVRSYIAILGSLGFAFATYTPIIISAGHITKVWAMAYGPALIGGVILLYNRKYLYGFALTALFTMQEIGRNHQQVSYYIFLILGIITLAYLVSWVKNKEYSHAFKAIGLVIVAGLLGVGANAVNLFTTYDYTKYSKRGGQLILSENDKKKENTTTEINGKTKGLSREYAFQWSYGKAETFTLMFPGVMGYGSRGGELTPNSHVAKFFQEKAGQSEEQSADIAKSMSSALYWGQQPFTDGTVYLGAVICFLFIFGLTYVKSVHKWWILISSVFFILLSWGHNFPAFNNFIFDHFPFYNKFRVPTMSLIVPQMLFPMLGVLAIEQLVSSTAKQEELWKSLKTAVIATAGVFVIAGLLYLQLDYKNENTQRTAAFNEIISSNSPDAAQKLQALNSDEKYIPQSDNRLYEDLIYQTKGNKDIAQGVLNALRQDRAATFGKDIFRSLMFILPVVVLLGLFIRRKISMNVLYIGIGIFLLSDLLLVDNRYLNEESFVDTDQLQTQSFAKTDADETILKDKEPDFRVFNMSNGKDPFQESMTSYYHKSIGGYNAAKIGIYDDLITYQLSGRPNPQVVNMLNTKYIIQTNPQTNKPVAIENPERLGNSWIVKTVKLVSGPAEEMKALSYFNAKDTAIVEDIFKSQIPSFTYDSTATIKQVKFSNDAITYETSAASPQVAVLSEIYYPGGWNMYIDGKKTDYFKANYVLRGIVIPQGKHTIDFKFEPASYKAGYTIASISNIIVLLVLIGSVSMIFIQARKKDTGSSAV